jgi:3-deoxy-D-manno-octulosonic-acid transferase
VSHPLYTAAAWLAVGGVYAPMAAVRRVTHGVPVHLAERLGHWPPLPGTAPRMWVHAVSVGEAIAATPLVDGLCRTYPGSPLVISTVTDTGARVVGERFGRQATHRFLPLDLPGAVRRAVNAVAPRFLICMETELWPNLFHALSARGVPVMIANGRLSDRSFRRYGLVRGFMRSVLADVRVFAMQSPEDARRIVTLGAPSGRVFVTGNLKHDVALEEPDDGAARWRRLLGIAQGAPLWVAGSTHRGEEDAVVTAHAEASRHSPDLALVLAPRHPERVREVEALLESRGCTTVRRSALGDGWTPNGARRPIVILDTVGELARLYAAADVVFVGGSLVAAGGHNVLEPAARGKPVLIGPHVDNFRDAAGLLTRTGAARTVADASDLGAQLTTLLADPALRERVGAAGRAAVASHRGAMGETLALVARLLTPGEGT